MQSIAVAKDDLRNYFARAYLEISFGSRFAKNFHSVNSISMRIIVGEARHLEIFSPFFLLPQAARLCNYAIDIDRKRTGVHRRPALPIQQTRLT